MLHMKRKSDRFHGNQNFTTSQKIRYNAAIMIHVARRGIGVRKRPCTSQRGPKAPASASADSPKHSPISLQCGGGGERGMQEVPPFYLIDYRKRWKPIGQEGCNVAFHTSFNQSDCSPKAVSMHYLIRWVICILVVTLRPHCYNTALLVMQKLLLTQKVSMPTSRSPRSSVFPTQNTPGSFPHEEGATDWRRCGALTIGGKWFPTPIR